jgi:hypothetical protein
MATSISLRLLPGGLLLAFGIYAVVVAPAVITGDVLVAGAVLIAGAKISYSIDQFRKTFEDRQSA